MYNAIIMLKRERVREEQGLPKGCLLGSQVSLWHYEQDQRMICSALNQQQNPINSQTIIIGIRMLLKELILSTDKVVIIS